MSNKRLAKNEQDKMIFGVASGIADYLDIDPTIIRLLFVIMFFAGGPGLIAYLILALVMPSEQAPVAKANSFDEEEIVVKDA